MQPETLPPFFSQIGSLKASHGVVQKVHLEGGLSSGHACVYPCSNKLLPLPLTGGLPIAVTFGYRRLPNLTGYSEALPVTGNLG